ncbi:uncharacterized protein LOC129780273 [Toxorhynchites rutilus septentrionalis]|uniref:uncharacterized protein LOC129780273 n=1 Tax=Toxorhynchites rutilus septentrionalis TaxID=329112 RepID=UPI002479C693|nr:uncharacterized protein LOC129780273 [Toxorhynchites rutilus septentrionalis]
MKNNVENATDPPQMQQQQQSTQQPHSPSQPLLESRVQVSRNSGSQKGEIDYYYYYGGRRSRRKIPPEGCWMVPRANEVTSILDTAQAMEVSIVSVGPRRIRTIVLVPIRPNGRPFQCIQASVGNHHQLQLHQQQQELQLVVLM